MEDEDKNSGKDRIKNERQNRDGGNEGKFYLYCLNERNFFVSLHSF